MLSVFFFRMQNGLSMNLLHDFLTNVLHEQHFLFVAKVDGTHLFRLGVEQRVHVVTNLVYLKSILFELNKFAGERERWKNRLVTITFSKSSMDISVSKSKVMSFSANRGRLFCRS